MTAFRDSLNKSRQIPPAQDSFDKSRHVVTIKDLLNLFDFAVPG
jgi:hypothetical protein